MQIKKGVRPEYNVDYSDANITLFHLATISFSNNFYKDSLSKYLLIVKDSQSSPLTVGCEFYGHISLLDMNDFKYRKALIQALEQNLSNGKTYVYIGALIKQSSEYFLEKNMGQEMAAYKFEKMQKEKLKEKTVKDNR